MSTKEQEVDDEEDAHWRNVKRTMLSYLDFIELDLGRRQQRLNRMSPEALAHLPPITFSKFGDIQEAAVRNQKFFDDLVKFQPDGVPRKNDGPEIHISAQHRNQAVLHSLFREWSAEVKTNTYLRTLYVSQKIIPPFLMQKLSLTSSFNPLTLTREPMREPLLSPP